MASAAWVVVTFAFAAARLPVWSTLKEMVEIGWLPPGGVTGAGAAAAAIGLPAPSVGPSACTWALAACALPSAVSRVLLPTALFVLVASQSLAASGFNL